MDDVGHVHISVNIAKLGESIPSVSLPVGITCRPDAPCFRKCYARHGRFSFKHNAELLRHNLEVWNAAPDVYEGDIMAVARFAKFFRYHSAGDIPDLTYLSMMSRVAEASVNTKFLCFTKKYELVDSFVDSGGVIPDNLVIVYSAWGDFVPENKHGFPVAYIRFRRGDTPGIPENAHQCSGFCGDCVLTGCSCWDLKRGVGDCVVFNEH